ncbi:amidase [Variovorax paradoxus]|uniref:amidase n=1 Tax=Variovorax paradoxus TaxID=34073 RepID=UPI003D65BD97
MKELWQLDAGALAEAYRDGTLSPVEAMRSVLQRLDAVNPRIRAVVARDDGAALGAARESEARWRRGTPLSMLDGVPVSVKDNIPVRGFPCCWGSRLFADHRPARDEAPVARLRAAGAILFAKTNIPEFTLQGYTANALSGTTRNPWNLDLTPGGSSGGAVAAVAAGIGPLALATDGGGSIRRPCAYTGLIGLKPTWDAVPRADGLPEMLPGLEVIGPIARTTADLVRILQVLAPAMHAIDLAAPPPRPQRIAYWRAIAGSPVDAAIADQVDAVAVRLRTMGHVVIDAEAPDAVARFNREAWPVLSATGLAAVLRDRTGDEGLLSPAMAELLAAGRRLSAVDLFAAQALQREARIAMARLFESRDLILTPSCAAMPWAAARSHPSQIAGCAVGARGHAVFTAFVNGAGLPALNLPAEPGVDGLPIGFQLVGPQGSDALLCTIGHAFEQRHPWQHRRPALAAVAPLSEVPSA